LCKKGFEKKYFSWTKCSVNCETVKYFLKIWPGAILKIWPSVIFKIWPSVKSILKDLA